MQTFSQNSEQDFILDFYKGKSTGRFLDIGAYHVERFSNVRALYLLGWGGTLVEPQPVNFNAIYEHYKNDPKITTLNMAVGETTGEIKFWESDGDAVGTTDEEHMKKWAKAGVKFTEIVVPQLNVVDFFNEFCVDIDFLNIDVESTNLKVFRLIPEFVWKQISLLCIEHDGGHDEIEEKLIPFGFGTLHLNAENILLGKS